MIFHIFGFPHKSHGVHVSCDVMIPFIFLFIVVAIYVLIIEWLVVKWFIRILIHPPLSILGVQKLVLELGSFEKFNSLREILKFEHVAKKKYLVPSEEIFATEEFHISLDDLDKIENKKETLRENLKEENNCIKKLREQIKKFKERHREVSD